MQKIIRTFPPSQLTPVSALRYGPAGAWPAINTIAHTVESVKLYCGKLKVGLLSRY